MSTNTEHYQKLHAESYLKSRCPSPVGFNFAGYGGSFPQNPPQGIKYPPQGIRNPVPRPSSLVPKPPRQRFSSIQVMLRVIM